MRDPISFADVNKELSAYRHGTKVGVVALMALTCAVSAIDLGRESFWMDEAFSQLAARLPIGELWQLSTTLDPHTTLWHLMLSGWLALYDGGEAWSRAIPLAFGALLIPVTFAIAKRLFDQRIAWCAALMLATHASLVEYNQEARPYTLMVLLTSVAVLGLLRALDADQKRDWAMFAVAFGAAPYAHPFAICALAAIVGFVLLTRDRRQKLILATGVGLILSSPLYWLVATLSKNDNLHWIPPVGLDSIRSALAFLGSGNGIIGAGVVAVFVAIAVLTYRRNTREEAWAKWFVLIWMLSTPGLLIITSLIQPVYVSRYLIPSVPAFAIALAYTVCRGADRIGRSHLSYAGAALFALFSLTQFDSPAINIDKPEWRERAKDPTVVAPRGEEAVVAYYRNQFPSRADELPEP